MHKLLFIILLLMGCAVGCTSYHNAPDFPNDLPQSGKYISHKEAYNLAVEGFKNFGFTSDSRRTRYASVNLYDPSRFSRNSVPQDTTFYIVNFEDGGFAVVAAQRNIPNPIFGISEKGTFDAVDNPNLQYYMNLGAEYYSSDRFNPWVRPDTVYKIILDTTIIYTNRYVPTIWGQWSPYNFYCPPKSTGIGNCPTGCIPLAIGQLMAYHRYPSSIKFNEYETSLNWDHILMANNIHDLAYVSDIGVNEIQKLLRICGLIAKVTYTDSVTYTKMSNAQMALNEIGFTARLTSIPPNMEDCLNSLKNYGPIIMSGVARNHDIGHAWLADASKIAEIRYRVLPDGIFKTEYYFNMVWGGQGNGDGFFVVPLEFDSIVSPLKSTVFRDIRCILDINPAP